MKLKHITITIALVSTVFLSGFVEANEATEKTKMKSVMCAVISRYMADLPEPSITDYQLAASFHAKAIKTYMEIDHLDYTDASIKVTMVESKITGQVKGAIFKKYKRNNKSRYLTAKGALMKGCY